MDDTRMLYLVSELKALCRRFQRGVVGRRQQWVVVDQRLSSINSSTTGRVMSATDAGSV